MDIKLDENLPIYMQIMNRFRQQMASGHLKAGDRIPPVRELAEKFGVNPNTMQRALYELEKEKLLYTERTSGRFVTKDSTMIETLRMQEANLAVTEFWRRMKALGFSTKEVEKLFFSAAKHEIRVG